MKKILVPTDFSKESEYALKVAAKLAKTYGSEIYLVHLLDLPIQEVDPLSSPSELPAAMFFMELAKEKSSAIKLKLPYDWHRHKIYGLLVVRYTHNT